MPLKQKIDADDRALLEIMEDPIWFGEFLRNTTDGEIDKSLWPKQLFKYRDYQKQFLTDQSEFILYTGGRAIGKCSPATSRILVVGEGYKQVSDLAKLTSFVTYALTPEMTVEQRRAVCIPDKTTNAFTVRTASGHEFSGTSIHPLLTPEGYKTIHNLQVGDYVAVATRLPHDSVKRGFQWHELRVLGYFLLNTPFRPEMWIKPRFNKIAEEFEVLAKRLRTNWRKNGRGEFMFLRKKNLIASPITSLIRELGLQRQSEYHLLKIPAILKSECLENIQIFLEALFAQHGELSTQKVSVSYVDKRVGQDLQELLLRFGVESKVTDTTLELLDYRAVYRFWNTFNIPGVTLGKMQLPPASDDASDFMRFDRIESITEDYKATMTYAVHVYENNNYIGDNFYVHNSIVLEDKMVYDVVNSDINFPVTPETVLVTSNQAQMTPLQNRLIMRFTSSKILKDFLKNNVNKSTGVMTFPRPGKPYILTMRIAGSRGEHNMVGLHVPKIIGDECQLFPLPAFTQLSPVFNSWEPKRQQIWAGVPNGIRNSVLYLLDKQTDKYKKYRIPAPANPYYTYENYIDDIKRYGGEQDDRFQQLILGRHGAAAFQVIPRESIGTAAYAFHNFRYTSAQKIKGITYEDVLERPNIPDNVEQLILAIDTGFVDPTLIQVIGRTRNQKWQVFVRYRITRIDFHEQEKIIDWLATHYQADKIAIDISAGGGGAGIMHNLISRDEYRNKKYNTRIKGIQFSEHIVAGYDEDGDELYQDAKSFAATELAKTIQAHQLIFSELDHEGISQMERVAKQKATGGRDRFFVMNDKGAGADEDDHIFASFICFILAIRDVIEKHEVKRLGRASGSYT